jgi:GrpB-like predicted nucleotidyltransferase (UPF0157 family)
MGYENRRYSVVPYREEWRAIYEREAELIKKTLGNELVFIEHVGGTAVPGLCGASAIDIIAVVRDISRVDRCNTAFKMIGYDAHGAYLGASTRLFKKNLLHETGEVERLVNLHIFPDEHPTMMEMLDVRDYLLAHKDEAWKYHRFKEKLFQKHPRDYAAYRDGKGAYLAKLSKKAAKWKGRRIPDEMGTV